MFSKSTFVNLWLVLLAWVFIGPIGVLDTDSSFADDPPGLKEIEKIASQGPFQPNWKSLESYEIPQWYKDAKFGIFIHWGVYSVPAFGSEWYPRNMYIEADGWKGRVFRHHLEKYGKQSEFGYKDFIPKFNAEKFDPAAWVELFKASGARYVVPVAEHHDGFPLYDCSYTRWDATEMGPKRDIIAELGKATRKAGLKFGVSSHRAFNWMYFVRSKEFDNSDPQLEEFYGQALPGLFKENADNYKENYLPYSEEFKDAWLTRTAELIEQSEPDLIWFDFGIGPKKGLPFNEQPMEEHLQKFAAYFYNQAADRNQQVVLNYKWNAFPEKTAVLDLERSKMDKIRTPFWQTDTAVSSSSWGYTENQKYKPTNRLVDDLIDIVSKNGCLLLNVGPRADGTIPNEDQQILREIGDWLKINGEAIYGSRHWKIFGEGPTGTATGHLSEKKNKTFQSKDIRFTTKGDHLYAFLLDWPKENEALITSLGTSKKLLDKSVVAVELLGSEEKLSWSHTKNGLRVELPNRKPCKFAYCLKISTN